MGPILNFVFYHTPIFYLIQSLWRDEAFSYFMAVPPIHQIIINTAKDFNPPFYYIFLHLWINFISSSDSGMRIVSFIAHTVTAYYAFLLGNVLFSRKFAFFVSAFTFFNPMLLYYAFEVRMYSLYALFTLVTVYYFYLRNWRMYTLFAVLGFYTHSFFIFVPVSLGIYHIIFLKRKIRKVFLPAVYPFLFYLPWLPVLFSQFLRSKGSWLYPVDVQLIKSSLGNLFTNYEGTPWYLWSKTAVISAVLILFFLIGFLRNRKRQVLFLLPIFLPLTFILAYSILRQPLYVNRYLIFVTVFEIIALCMGIWSIRSRFFRWIAAAGWLLFVFYFNIYITPFHKKTDFKTALAEINRKSDSTDFVYTKTPIAFLETAYYYKNRDRVFIYNPQEISVPNYIGVKVVFPDASKPDFPTAPSRTFLIDDDASYEIIVRD